MKSEEIDYKVWKEGRKGGEAKKWPGRVDEDDGGNRWMNECRTRRKKEKKKNSSGSGTRRFSVGTAHSRDKLFQQIISEKVTQSFFFPCSSISFAPLLSSALVINTASNVRRVPRVFPSSLWRMVFTLVPSLLSPLPCCGLGELCDERVWGTQRCLRKEKQELDRPGTKKKKKRREKRKEKKKKGPILRESHLSLRPARVSC